MTHECAPTNMQAGGGCNLLRHTTSVTHTDLQTLWSAQIRGIRLPQVPASNFCLPCLQGCVCVCVLIVAPCADDQPTNTHTPA